MSPITGILGTAVQDQQGRPRRDISTIAHILNDLLQAAPFYKQHLSSLCCQHRGSRHRDHANSKTSQYRAQYRPTTTQNHQQTSKGTNPTLIWQTQTHNITKLATFVKGNT